MSDEDLQFDMGEMADLAEEVHSLRLAVKQYAQLYTWVQCEVFQPPPGITVLTYGPLGHVIGHRASDGRWQSEHCDNETGEPYLPDAPPWLWMSLPVVPNAWRNRGGDE